MKSSLKAGNSLKMTLLSAVFGALLVVGQVIMGPLPNIEPVTTLLLIFSAVIGKYSFISVYVFVFVEGLIYGFGTWWLGYLYVWVIPVALGMLLKNCKNSILIGAISAFFGLMFGLLTSPPEFLFGKGYGISKLISGIPFDILHCIGNFIITSIFWLPLKSALQKAVAKLKI